jgi:hypothetical protein
VICLALGVACGQSSNDASSGDEVDAATPGKADARVALAHDAGGSRTDATSGHPSEEICDGVDNDGNGVVDDRDVESDGVCDCLAIAYLGTPTGAKAGDVFADWLDQRSDFGAKPLTSITPENLAKYDVLVVQNLGLLGTSYTDAELDAIERWVEAGGGLLTLTGYGTLTEPLSVNTILARFGLSYRPPLVLLSPTGTASTLAITGWTHPHPVTDGITQIGFNNGYPVDGDGTALASEMGYDVLRAKEVGKGHVLAWGDEWITFDSEWSMHPDYQVERFWQNMIKWLTDADVCQVPIRVF